MVDANRHVVAIFGGACAGSTAADILAARGIEVVVFEQNLRPVRQDRGRPAALASRSAAHGVQAHRRQARSPWRPLRPAHPARHRHPVRRRGAVGVQRGAARQRRVARSTAGHPWRRGLGRSRAGLPEPLHLLVQPRPGGRLRRPPLHHRAGRDLHRRRTRVHRRRQGVPAGVVWPRARRARHRRHDARARARRHSRDVPEARHRRSRSARRRGQLARLPSPGRGHAAGHGAARRHPPISC